MNPVGWERFHDAHVAGKTTHTNTHTRVVIRQNWYDIHAFFGVCEKVLGVIIYLKIQLKHCPPEIHLSEQKWTILTCDLLTHTNKSSMSAGKGHLLHDCLTSCLAIQLLIVLNYSVFTRIRRKAFCYYRPSILLTEILLSLINCVRHFKEPSTPGKMIYHFRSDISELIPSEILWTMNLPKINQSVFPFSPQRTYILFISNF